MKIAQRLAVVASIAVLAACQSPAASEPGSSAPTVAPTTASPTPTPPSLATPDSTGLALRPTGEAITSASIDALIATPDGFLASGLDASSPILASGSPAGLSWQALDASLVFHAPLAGIATGPLGWVAAGRIDPPTASGLGVALWHSTDGQSWLRVPDQADLGGSIPGPVVAGPWGFAMDGQAVDSSGTSAPRVWVSRDGVAWSEMPRLEWDSRQIVAVDGGIVALGSERSAMTTDGITWIDMGSVPGGESGGVVAAATLGSDFLAISNSEAGAAVWRGTIGGSPSQPTLSWEGAGLDLSPEATMLTTLATGPLGALVLGFDRQTLRPISWVSRDSRTWRSATLEDAAFGGGTPAIAAVGTQAFVVLGWYGNEGGDTVARPWVSADGLAWAGSEPEQLGVLPGLPTGPCPANPTEAAQLIALAGSYPTIPAAAWTWCFEDRDLVLRGYVGGCGGCGGVAPYVGVPDWLLDPLGYARFWLLGEPPTQEGHGLSISVQIDPGHPVRVPETGAHVRVTGHFDDPAAQRCRLIPTEAGTALPPSGATIARCRQQFVVTAIEVLPG